MDERLAPSVDLLTQVADVQLDDVGLATEVVVPDAVQDLCLAQYPARVAHQEAQQLELGGGQVDQLPAAANLAGVLVHRQVGDGQLGGCIVVAHPGATQHPPQTGQHLLEAERLGHVIVSSGRDPGDPVLDRVAGGQEEHAHPGVVLAQPAHHLQAVEVRQHHVEHDCVRPELATGADGADPCPRALYVPPFVSQHTGQDLGEVRFVVHHQDADRCTVRAAQAGGLGAVLDVGHRWSAMSLRASAGQSLTARRASGRSASGTGWSASSG